MSLGRSELFSFVNTSANLLGDDWQGNSSSRKIYTSLLARLTSTYYCFVLQGVFQHLGYCLWWILSCFWSGNSLEVSASFLRLISSFLSNVFRRRLWSCQKSLWSCFRRFPKRVSEDVDALFDCIHTIWIYLYLPISLGGIHSCRWIVLSYDCSSDGFCLGGSCLSLSSLWWQGLRKFWRDCFAPSWGALSLTLPPLFNGIEGIDRLPPFSSTGFWVYPYFPMFYEEGRIK